MRAIRTALTALLLTAITTLTLAAPAHATECGDTAGAWVPTGGSIWTGTAGTNNIVLVAIPTLTLAVTTLGVIPLTGQWALQGSFRWTGVGAGGTIDDFFEVNPTSCDGSGNVTAGDGSGHDAVGNNFAVSITRSA